MDALRFDDLARAFGRKASRRAVLRAAAGGAVAGALLHAGVPSAAAQDTCDAGLTTCDGECVDLMSDLENCGTCGNSCVPAAVGINCIEGVCVRISCPAALPTYCGTLGEEDPNYVDNCADLETDPNNCGACGNVCASGVCDDGVCAPDAGGDSGGGVGSLPSTGSGSRPSESDANWSKATFAAAAFGVAAMRQALRHLKRD